MGKFNDLTGRTFGRLTALYRTSSSNGRVYWVCQCTCGKLSRVQSSNLVSGLTRSCGCYRDEVRKRPCQRLYPVWVGHDASANPLAGWDNF